MPLCPFGPFYIVGSWSNCGISGPKPFVAPIGSGSPGRAGYGDGFLDGMPSVYLGAGLTLAAFSAAAVIAGYRYFYPTRAATAVPVPSANQPFLPAVPQVEAV